MLNAFRSASLTNYEDVARRAGLDPVRMLDEFSLPHQCLQERELRVPADAVRRLLEASAERSGEEAFGLMMAEARHLSDLGPLGLLVREQPTLRLALETFVRNSPRLTDTLFLTLEESDDSLLLREELLVGRSGSMRQANELVVGIVFRMVQSLLGPGWRPRRVCFVHAAPRIRAVHDRIFGLDVVRFDQEFNGIVCARADLGVPNPTADPGLARLARSILESSAPDDAPGVTAQVKDLVVPLLGTGDCSVERVAQCLGVDRRTVHRHLAREGSTFSGVVDAVRRELAVRYVGDLRRPLASVSAKLGFSAPSSFSRWYRQEFGVSPSRDRTRGSRRPLESSDEERRPAG